MDLSGVMMFSVTPFTLDSTLRSIRFTGTFDSQLASISFTSRNAVSRSKSPTTPSSTCEPPTCVSYSVLTCSSVTFSTRARFSSMVGTYRTSSIECCVKVRLSLFPARTPGSVFPADSMEAIWRFDVSNSAVGNAGSRRISPSSFNAWGSVSRLASTLKVNCPAVPPAPPPRPPRPPRPPPAPPPALMRMPSASSSSRIA